MRLTSSPPARPRFRTAAVLLAACLCQPLLAAAQSGDDLGAVTDVVAKPLQELINKKRVRGLIFVTIPQARVYGLGSGYRAYCSPQIRAINTSDRTVQDLIVGIRYTDKRQDVGSTVTRFSQIKVGKQETHYFYSTIDADHCLGLTGDVEVVRCVYDNGVACGDDVRSVDYGAVKLRIVNKKKENK